MSQFGQKGFFAPHSQSIQTAKCAKSCALRRDNQRKR